MSTETVTLLFTDLVGSTELLSRLGEERAEELRREHFGLLRAALGEGEGREVKNLGDGLMAVFSSASGGVAGAIRMQQRIEGRNRRTPDEPLAIRCGLSTGECDVDGHDYFGAPAVEAARLCAAAQGGQILATDLVRALAGSRGGHRFEPLGPIDLKGFAVPVDTVKVAWAPAPVEPEGLTGVPVPPRLAVEPVAGFVGRTDELARIADALKQSETGALSVMLIAGEAGIGKTSLVARAASAASEAGAVILYGRCDEELGVSYQPWVEALRHLVENAPSDLLAEYVARRGADLGRMIPELTVPGSGEPDSRSTDPETERYLLFGAVLSLIETASAIAPIVLVLDDLHWADKPSLLLLRHLVAATSRLRVTVLGTYRPTDVAVGHPLSDLLASFHREVGVDRLVLDGLADDEIVQLVEAAAGQALDLQGVGLAHALYRETDGNPFFAGEILRHLVETGALFQNPDGRWISDMEFRGGQLPWSAREVIGRRVARLGDIAERALRAASVIGREFDLSLLHRVTDLDDEVLVEAMEAASASAIVSEIAGVPDRFAFAHALVEHTLYEDLSLSRRARLHRRVAEAIEDTCADDPGDRVGELAYHWARATAPREPTKAIEYACHAGDRALAALAPDDALRWYRQALDLLDPEFDDKRAFCSILVRLGDAQRQAGDAAYRATLLDAAHRAQEDGANDLLVLAALANSRGFFSAVGSADEERISVLEAALDAVGNAASPNRARLLALLAQELVPTGNLARRRTLSDEAILIARSLEHKDTLLHVLNLRFNAILGQDTLAERRNASLEAVNLAEHLGDPVARFFAEMFGAFAALDAGDRDELDRAASIAIPLADEIGQPTLKWVATWERALQSWLDGDLEETEKHTLDAFSIGFDSGQPDATVVPGVLLMTLRWAQGRTEEIEPVLMQMLADQVGLPGLNAGVAQMCCENGRFDEARRVLEAEKAGDFASIGDDPYPLSTLVLWSHVISDLQIEAAAEMLLPQLIPHADEIGSAGVIVFGAAATAIGQLQTVVGDLEEAEAAFRHAVFICERLRSPYMLALTYCAWARLALRRSDSDEHAQPLLNRALKLAQRYGFAGVEHRVERIQSGAFSTRRPDR